MAYVGGQLFGGGESVGGGGPMKPPAPKNAVTPVQSEAVEQPLEAKGFACYTTFEEPSSVRSCYRTEQDGLQLTVHLLSNETDEVVRVLARTKQPSPVGSSIPQPGDAEGPMRELIPLVSKALLGPDAKRVPSFELGGQRQTKIAWGRIEFDVQREGGHASFVREGAPEMPGDVTFEKDPEAMRAGLAEKGYRCDGSSCTSTSNTYDLRASFTAEDATMSVVAYDNGPKVSDAVLKKRFGDLLSQVVSGPNLSSVKKWVSTNLQPGNGSAQADVGGTHFELVRSDEGGALVISPPSVS